jgi:sugar phosphate isomerase/epimerase
MACEQRERRTHDGGASRTMKLSCLPVSFFSDIQAGRMTIREWASCARAEGLDSIDLSAMLIQNHTSRYLQQIAEDLARENMPITMITTYPDFTHPDPRQREREMEYARYDVAIAGELGAKYLRILAGQAHPETTIGDGIAWVVESFTRLDEIAARHHVMLLFENHSKPGAWSYTDFSHPTKIFLEIFGRIRNTGIRINFDTANTLVFGDDPMPVLDEVMDRIETVHAADTARRGELAPVLLGTGIVPFDRIFTRLKSSGFDGWICIEEASRTGRPGFVRAVHFVRTTWEAA